MMKLLFEKLKFKSILIYSKINAFIFTIMILGILELGFYYEILISLMALLAPEFVPIIIVIFIGIFYKGIKRLYQSSRNKKSIFIF